jgi:hypothetical protein
MPVGSGLGSVFGLHWVAVWLSGQAWDHDGSICLGASLAKSSAINDRHVVGNIGWKFYLVNAGYDRALR